MLEKYEFIDADDSNVDTCLCCGATNSIGVRRKREWIRQCLPDGLRYKIVLERATGKQVGMIEYMPGDRAWRSVHAPNWMVIHCLMVWKRCQRQGLGTLLIRQCLADARKHGMNGVVALATEQTWCADSRIYLKNGFNVVDRAAPSFELMAKSLRKTKPPHFGNWEQRLQKSESGITIFYSKQCPYIRGEKEAAREKWLAGCGLKVNLTEITDYKAAQANPCVWGTGGVLCDRTIINYVTGGRAHLAKALKRIINIDFIGNSKRRF